jgi:hypothetical protein
MKNLVQRSFWGVVAAVAMTSVSCRPPVEKQQPPPPTPAQSPFASAGSGTIATPAGGPATAPVVPGGVVTSASAPGAAPAYAGSSSHAKAKKKRYQIVVGNEDTSEAVLFLLDTRDGGTWIYRPPSGVAFNGFWSDIPRLTYPPETWQQVFQTMVKQAQAQQQQPAPAATR